MAEKKIEQTISKIDVKRNNGSDISGAEEKKFRDSVTKYLNAQKNSLSNEDYIKLEKLVVQFLKNVDTDFSDLATKYEALKSAITAPRSAIKVEINTAQIKNSAESILDTVKNTNIGLAKKITEYTEKEQSYLNFISPENMLGLSTRLLDGNTVTGLKLESLRSFSERSSASERSLQKIINDLSSGKSFTDIQKEPSLKSFFASPEGQYTLDKSKGRDETTCYQNYNLNVARLYKNVGLPIIAESYYDKLDGTMLEGQVKGERMSKLERFRQDWLTTFANEFLSLDQLAIMAAGGVVGKGVGVLVGKSEALSKAAVIAGKAIEGSKVAKVLLPGVQILKSNAGEKLSIAVGKGIINIGLDVTKFAAYSYAAEKIGGEDAGKAVRIVLAVIPGAKAGFEAQMNANLAKDATGSLSGLADWMITKYGKAGTENMIYAGLVEKAKAEAMKSGQLFKGLPKSTLEELGGMARKTVDDLESLIKSRTNIPSIYDTKKPIRPRNNIEGVPDSHPSSATNISNIQTVTESKTPVLKEGQMHPIVTSENTPKIQNTANSAHKPEVLPVKNESNLVPTKPQGINSPSFSQEQAIIKSGALGETTTKAEKVAATVKSKTPTLTPKTSESLSVYGETFGTQRNTYKVELLPDGSHKVLVKKVEDGVDKWVPASKTSLDSELGGSANATARIENEVSKLKAKIKTPTLTPKTSESLSVYGETFGTQRNTYKVELLPDGSHKVLVKKVEDGVDKWVPASKTSLDSELGGSANATARIENEVSKLKAKIKTPTLTPKTSESLSVYGETFGTQRNTYKVELLPDGSHKVLVKKVEDGVDKWVPASKTSLDSELGGSANATARIENEVSKLKAKIKTPTVTPSTAELVKKQPADLARVEKNPVVPTVKKVIKSADSSKPASINKEIPNTQSGGVKHTITPKTKVTDDIHPTTHSDVPTNKLAEAPVDIIKNPSKLKEWMKHYGLSIGVLVLAGGELYLLAKDKKGEPVLEPVSTDSSKPNITDGGSEIPSPFVSPEDSSVSATNSVSSANSEKLTNPNEFNEGGSLDKYKDRIETAIQELKNSKDPKKKELGKLLKEAFDNKLSKNDVIKLQTFMIDKWSEFPVSKNGKPDGLFGELTMQAIESILQKKSVVSASPDTITPVSASAPSVPPNSSVPVAPVVTITPTSVRQQVAEANEKSNLQMTPRQIGDLIITLMHIENEYPQNDHPTFKLNSNDIKILSELSKADIAYMKTQLRTEAENDTYATPGQVQEHRDYWNAYIHQLDEVIKNYKGQLGNIRLGSNQDIAGLKEADKQISKLTTHFKK